MINSWNWKYQFLRFYRNFFCKTQIYTCNLHYNMYLYPLFTDIIVLIVRCAYLFSYGLVVPIKIRHRLTQSLNYFPSDVCACICIWHFAASQVFYCVFFSLISLLKERKRDIPNAIHLMAGSCNSCFKNALYLYILKNM